MQCPRCGQPTRVIDTRVHGARVRRIRMCGHVKAGKLITPTCQLRFPTVEVPIGWERKVSVRMTDQGIQVEVLKKETNR